MSHAILRIRAEARMDCLNYYV